MKMKGQTEVTSGTGFIIVKLLLVLCLIGIVIFLIPMILRAFGKS